MSPASSPGATGRTLPPGGFIVLLGLLSSLGPAAFNVYVPGVPEVARDLDAPQWMAQGTMASFMIGIGLGQLTIGSVSDIFGRRRPLLVSLAVFGTVSAACALAPTIEVLLGARFLQGIAAASGMVISRAIVRDLHAGREGARVLSLLVAVYGLAPVLAPIFGAQVLDLTSWRGVFVTLVGLTAVLALATAVLLPETHPDHLRRDGLRDTRADIALLLRSPLFVACGLFTGLAAGAIGSYLATSSFVLQDLYGVSPLGYSAILGVTGVGLLIGSQLNARLLRRHEPVQLLRAGISIGVANGVAMVALVLLDAPLGALCVTFFAMLFTWGMIPTNSVALAMADHPQRAGTASSLIGLFQYGIAACAVPIVGAFGASSALPMAVAVMTLFAASLPILWFGVRPRHLRASERRAGDLIVMAEVEGDSALDDELSRAAAEPGSARSPRPDR